MSLLGQRKLRKRWKRSTATRSAAQFLAVLGDGNGTVVVPGRPNMRYVRPVGETIPMVVKGGAAPTVEGVRVWVGRENLRGSLTILGVASSGSSIVATGVIAHGDTHIAGGADPAYIDINQVINALCYASSTTALTVVVNGGFAIVDSQPVHWMRTNVDMTSHVPETGALWALIRVDNTGAITVQDGTPVAAFVDLSLSDLPAVEDGYRVLGIVRLYAGQTALNRTYASPDVIPLHLAPETGGGAVTAADVSASTTNFGGVLSVADDTVQKALDTLDNHTHAESSINLDHGAYIYSTCFWYDGTNKDLVLFISADGYTFQPITINKVFTEDETHYLQEPSIIWHGGYWWICYTHGTTGTADCTDFKVIKSSDLINWSLIATVDMSAITGVDAVWAPEFFIDGDTVRVYVTCTTNGDHINGFKIYEVHATAADLTTWSAPAEVTGTGLPSSIIDAFVYKEGSTYYLVYKDNATEYICYATSTSPTSGFTEISDGDWAGWGVQSEGPTLIQLPDGRYRMYLQHYETSPSYEATQWWSEADAIDGTWSDKVEVVTPWPVVHGTVLRVTDPDALGIVLAATLQSDNSRVWIDLPEYVNVGSPSANFARIFTKDVLGVTTLFYKRSDGTEIELGTGGTGSGSANVSHALVRRAANQNVNNTTDTAIIFDAEDVDTDNFTDPGGATPTRITVPETGVYLFVVDVIWENNSTGNRYINLKVNDTTWRTLAAQVAVADTRQSGSIALALNADDYVEVYVYQTSGGTRTIKCHCAYVARLAGGIPDAADITYTPTTLTDWDSDTDPGDVDAALDQLAERVDDLEGGAGHAAVTLAADADTLLSLSTQEIGLDVQTANYVLAGPATGADADPTFRALVAADLPAISLDDLSDVNAAAPTDGQVLTWDNGAGEWIADDPPAGGVVDADDVTYTPTTLTDWDSDADPGDVEQALDQLAERVDDLEGGAGHAAVTLAADADTILSLSTQEIGLDTQTANYVLAGPTSGAAADPTFRALVEADIASLLQSGWFAAGETWTYASADDPTFTFTIAGVDLMTKYYVGMKIKLTQATGGTKYFIITKTDYVAPNTTITVYGGTDYNLEDEAISAPYWSMMKAPAGFPLDPTKWTVEVTDTSDRSQATPNASTWYNPGSITISIPIGGWKVNYQCCIMATDTNVTTVRVKSTLSTANNSESDADFTTALSLAAGTGAAIIQEVRGMINREKYLVLATKTSYYLNILTAVSTHDSIQILGVASKTIIRAICAYL